MSCREMAREINEITKHLLKMHDERKISKAAVLELIGKFQEIVVFRDLEEREALADMTATHCACCLKKYESPDDAVSQDDLDAVVRVETSAWIGVECHGRWAGGMRR